MKKFSRILGLATFGTVCIFVGCLVPSAPVSIEGVKQESASAAPPLVTPQPLEVANANIFVELAKKVVPSVANISTYAYQRSRPNPRGFRGGEQDDLFRKFFEEFFGDPRFGGPRGFGPDGDQPKTGPKQKVPFSLGSGFVIDDGLIITNNHVVEGADEIGIRFTEDAQEKATTGEVVGRDPELDLALVRFKSSQKVPVLALGDSQALQVGEYVMAVGNPFGQGHSVTHGIISAKGREIPGLNLAKYLQTDAPINPGNSGGPLVNLKGEVIGINNAIDARAQGIGFAIPVNLVKQVLPQLKTKGSVARGYLGVLVNELTPEIATNLKIPEKNRGPLVTQVFQGQPADKAGLKAYDVIYEFNGERISSPGDLIKAVTQVPVGESATIKIVRDGKLKDLKIELAERPKAEQAARQTPKPNREKEEDRLGVVVEMLTPAKRNDLGLPASISGLLVTELGRNSPADRAGLRRGDVIMEVDRAPVKSVDHFMSLIKENKGYLLRVARLQAGSSEPSFAVIVLDLAN